MKLRLNYLFSIVLICLRFFICTILSVSKIFILIIINIAILRVFRKHLRLLINFAGFVRFLLYQITFSEEIQHSEGPERMINFKNPVCKDVSLPVIRELCIGKSKLLLLSALWSQLEHCRWPVAHLKDWATTLVCTFESTIGEGMLRIAR